MQIYKNGTRECRFSSNGNPKVNVRCNLKVYIERALNYDRFGFCPVKIGPQIVKLEAKM